MLFCCSGAYAQATNEIHGIVRDATDKPLSGVSIEVKGTQTVVLSNEQGGYRIRAREGQTLVFTFVGMEKKEVVVGKTTDIDITLTPSSNSLGDVVVIGYGTQKRRDVTGAISSITADEIQKQVVTNPLDALSSKVPGFSVSNNSGRPGGKMSVSIRGHSSISADNTPLFVIDGIIGANPELIDPNEIESVNILKDASATAIYGVQGTNGVVIITTRKPKVGEARIAYNVNFSLGKLARKVDMMDANEFMEWFKRAWAFDPNRTQLPDFAADYPDLFNTDETPKYNTDWQKESTRLAFSNQHFLTISSGTVNSKQSLSAGYQDNNGILLSTYYKKYTVNYVNEFKLDSWLTIGGSLGYDHVTKNQIDDYQVGAVVGPRAVLEMLPILPVQYPDGKYSTLNDFGYNVNADGSYTKAGDFPADNPVRLLKDIKWIFDEDQILANLHASIRIVNGLEFKTALSYQSYANKNSYFVNKDLLSLGTATNGVAEIGNLKNAYWQFDNTLNFNRTIHKNSINALLGASWNKGTGETVTTGQVGGFSTNYYGFDNLAAGTVTVTRPGSTYVDYKLNSYFARVNYAYDEKYLFTITGRYDGSSKFGVNNKYSFFPSAGLGWLLSKENFLKENKAINLLKLRAGYGITGNSAIPSYSSLGTITTYNVVLNNQLANGASIGTIPNANLRWERTSQVNIGLDLQLLGGRFGITADVYNKKTRDLLLSKPVSIVTGYTSVVDNIGSVENKGIEVAVFATVLQSDNFSWRLSANYAANRNKILRLGVNNEDIITGPPNFFLGYSPIIFRQDEPIGSIWGLERIGTWSTNEESEAAKYGRAPGDVKRLDVNGDYKFDNNDAMILGDIYPTYEMGISSNITYKNFELSVDVQIVQGNKIVNPGIYTLADRNYKANALTSVLDDAWTPDHQNTMARQLRFWSPDRLFHDLPGYIDSYWVRDGSFVRGKNIYLGYTFNHALLEKVKIKGLKAFFNVQNFFLITRYDVGFDPEVSTYSSYPFSQGMEFYGYPKPRTYTIGFNVNL
jgi:TonB-linked SusC/RagA family outer membrane protein